MNRRKRTGYQEALRDSDLPECRHLLASDHRSEFDDLEIVQYGRAFFKKRDPDLLGQRPLFQVPGELVIVPVFGMYPGGDTHGHALVFHAEILGSQFLPFGFLFPFQFRSEVGKEARFAQAAPVGFDRRGVERGCGTAGTWLDLNAGKKTFGVGIGVGTGSPGVVCGMDLAERLAQKPA